MKWRQGTIALAGYRPQEQIKAVILEDTGLAVHKIDETSLWFDGSRGWRVTHIKSGYCFNLRPLSHAWKARVFAEALTTIKAYHRRKGKVEHINWHYSKSTLFKYYGGSLLNGAYIRVLKKCGLFGEG